jgi:hypothetical protein
MECEMQARLSRLRIRELVLFVVVAGAVAVIAVLLAREAGIDEAQATAAPDRPAAIEVQTTSAAAQPASSTGSADEVPETDPPNESSTAEADDEPAVAQSDSLTLTLAAPATCETEAGRGGFGERIRIDADGNRTYEHVTLGLYGVAETLVSWSVTGGAGPYTLEIDGETRDATSDYTGKKGTASVSCALETGDVYFGPDMPGREVRRYRGEVVVDSGLKTIRAVATDANGDTAEASVDVYVILSTGDFEHLLRGGNTYRVLGKLLTVPSGIDMRIGDNEISDSGDEAQAFIVEGTNPFASVWVNVPSFEVISYNIPDMVRGADADTDLKSKFDELVASFGQLPATPVRLP